MKYPNFLTENSTIGVCAPSFGCVNEPYESRAKQAELAFEQRGHRVKFSPSCFKFSKGESAPASVRAKEFEDMYSSKAEAIISMAGGEYMIETLPYIDFEKLKQAQPKWFCGFSDNTVFTYALTVLCDVASIYGYCFSNFGMKIWHKTLEDNYNFLLGKNDCVFSQEKYEVESTYKLPNKMLDGFNCTKKVKWKILTKQKKVEFSGRLIGGCLDVLTCICGTKFDKIEEFLEKYKNDGFIWYLESCDLNVACQRRAMFQLKQSGWFKYCKGIILGRPGVTEEYFDCNYLENNLWHLKSLDVPVVIDADFGHISPMVHIINGAVGKVTCAGGKGKIEFMLK